MWGSPIRTTVNIVLRYVFFINVDGLTPRTQPRRIEDVNCEGASETFNHRWLQRMVRPTAHLQTRAQLFRPAVLSRRKAATKHATLSSGNVQKTIGSETSRNL